MRRMIPADEAQSLRENATPGSWVWGVDDNISYARGDGEPIEQGCSWRYVILGARLDSRGEPIVVYPWEATEWNENDNLDDEFYEPTVLMDERLSESDAALIAAAPDLAAEVIRLREALGGLREDLMNYREHANELANHLAFEVAGSSMERITRILEGDEP